MNSKQIVEKFSTRQPNKLHDGRVVWKSGNIYCCDELIFSYGTHFPMAKYLGLRDNKEFFIKNNDKFSSSTSAHQSLVGQYCLGPSVSNERLSEHIRFAELTMDHIHLWQPGVLDFIWKDTQTEVFYKDYDIIDLRIDDPEPIGAFVFLDRHKDEEGFKVIDLQRRAIVFKQPYKLPKNGEFSFCLSSNRFYFGDRFQQGLIKLKELLVLKFDNKYFLSENNNIVELKKEPKTIKQALKAAA